VKIVVRAPAGGVPLWMVDVGVDISDEDEEAELVSSRAPTAFVAVDISDIKKN
jgi:hypothetical protein